MPVRAAGAAVAHRQKSVYLSKASSDKTCLQLPSTLAM